MAKKIKTVSELLEGIETKKVADVIKVAKEIAEHLESERNAHQKTIEETGKVIEDLTSENDKLAKQASAAPKDSGNGSVKIDGKEYPIMLAKFQISKGKEMAGIYTAADVQSNKELAAHLLSVGSGVLGTPKTKE